VEPIEIPIDGVLDLHTFQPREVRGLVHEYILACLEKEIFSLRIIHGKGKGILKQTVQSALEKNPHVASFTDAPAVAGGWGATVVTLRPPETAPPA
jgi:DNA-nicking Smr family endonuclease